MTYLGVAGEVLPRRELPEAGQGVASQGGQPVPRDLRVRHHVQQVYGGGDNFKNT